MAAAEVLAVGLGVAVVSCGWKPFQRNCEALLQAGWLLGSASVYLLFPGTNQVELVVCFDRD